MKTVLVAGAGPAGMMAALEASRSGASVTLLEKNPSAGRKLLLTGKGRCNLTNTAPLDLFLQRFSHGQFLRDAFRQFSNEDLMSFFEHAGVKLKVERQGRVFPADDRSASVLKTLESRLKDSRVHLFFGHQLTDILAGDGGVKGAVIVSGGRRSELAADRIILATGGASYRFTGSDGQGIEICRRHGHSVVPLRPGLVPLVIRRDFDLPEGLTLKNIRLEFVRASKSYRTETGELLFTGSGISGPLVLTWSGKILEWLAQGKVEVFLDLKPALSEEQLERRLLRDAAAFPKRSARTLLREYLPLRLIDIVLARAGVAPGTMGNQLTRPHRLALIGCFKKFRMEITGSLALEEAMVTRGGVSLKEINPRTMESRLIKGLYLCGEMIDVDADTGGFNLQAAFSTGFLAGKSAAKD